MSRRANAAALLAYAAVAFLFFGRPVATHPGSIVIGHTTDPDIYIWSFGWWAHALTHGLNPIYTHAVWAPQGVDLAWASAAHGIAILFVPLTLLVGPVVSYNVASVAVTALAAWTAFLLCRYLTRSFWASIAGGYLFGFSSYQLAQQGHIFPTGGSVLFPLVALAALRFLDDRIGGRRFAVELGLLIGYELWISTEMAATTVVALLVGLGLGWAFVPGTRARIRASARWVLAAGAIAVVLDAPLLWYLLTDFRSYSINPPQNYVADLANFVVPTRITQIGGGWASSISERYLGNEFEQDAYFGLPLLALLALYLVPRRREPGARFVAAAIGVTVVASIGEALHIAGQRIVVFPWRLVSHLPVLQSVLPTRLVVFAELAAAVVVALWIARSSAPVWMRVALPLLAAAALFPNLSLGWWTRKPELPQFFAAGYDKTCIRQGDNVLAIPWGWTGDQLYWQSVSGFHYRIAGGGPLGAPIPSTFVGTIVSRLFNDHAHPGDGPDIVSFARGKGVSTIVVDPTDPQPWSSLLLQAFGPPTKTIGGVLLYQLSPGLVNDVACVSR